MRRPRGGLNCAAARIGDRELYETFATPFEAADKEAQVSAMMANYGEIDGIPVGGQSPHCPYPAAGHHGL